VVTDPPYHGVKADAWDNQWKTDAEFLRWVEDVCGHVSQKLEPHGSLYWFASPQMASRVEMAIARRFRVLNNIVWDKSGGRKGIGGTGIDVTALRCFWTANTERVIFAEQVSGDAAASEAAGYEESCVRAKAGVFGDYLRAEMQRAGVTNKAVAALFPSKTGGLTGCVSNWLLGLNVPTAEQYEAIRARLGEGYLKCEYEDLKREYEDLKREYEDLRRPFNLSVHDEWGDVWRFGLERDAEHPTQKPLALMQHIVKASSKRGQTVLDTFAGSGTTGVACIKLGRKFIGIEIEEKYFDIARRRIEEAWKQPRLFEEPREKVEQAAFDLGDQPKGKAR
jgi:site-specific DNA-methyltransferase (adenine-specific)